MIFLSLKYSVKQVDDFLYLLKFKGGLTVRAYYLFFKNMRENIKDLERLHPRSFGSLQAKLGTLLSIFRRKPLLGYLAEGFLEKFREDFREGNFWNVVFNVKISELPVVTSEFDFRSMGVKVLSYQVFRSILLEKRACLYENFYGVLVLQKVWRGLAYLVPPKFFGFLKNGQPFKLGGLRRSALLEKRKEAVAVGKRRLLGVENWLPCSWVGLPSSGVNLVKWPRFVLVNEHRRKVLCERKTDKILEKKEKIVQFMHHFWWDSKHRPTLVKHIKELLKRLAEVAKLSNLVKVNMESINRFRGSLAVWRKRFEVYRWQPGGADYKMQFAGWTWPFFKNFSGKGAQALKKNLVEELLVSSGYSFPIGIEEMGRRVMDSPRMVKLHEDESSYFKLAVTKKIFISCFSRIVGFAARVHHVHREQLYTQATLVEKLYGKAVGKVKTLTLKFRLLQRWAETLETLGRRFAAENYVARRLDAKVRELLLIFEDQKVGN
jgi:hypothetical protein